MPPSPSRTERPGNVAEVEHPGADLRIERREEFAAPVQPEGAEPQRGGRVDLGKRGDLLRQRRTQPDCRA